MKLHIKKGDSVVVVAGGSKGKSGKVLEVNRETSRAVVEGLNMVTKHSKPSASSPQGGINRIEAGIHISNLMISDPESGKPTRIGRKKDENGKSVRYAKKSQKTLK